MSAFRFSLALLSLVSLSGVYGEALAAKLYHCRAYVGGEFFSNRPCTEQRAVALASYDVPDKMPFDQQVKLIEARTAGATSAQTQQADANIRAQECASIDRQLDVLSKKYTNWQYYPVNEVNTDQARERNLKARRASLGCQ